MKIICDTNIWYGFASGKLDFNKFSHLHLTPTYTNLRELVITENVILNYELVKNALRYLMKLKGRLNLSHPFLHIAEINSFTHKIRNDGALELLNQAEIIANSLSLSDLGLNYTIANIQMEKKYLEQVPIFIRDGLTKTDQLQIRKHDQTEKMYYMTSMLVNQFINNKGRLLTIDSAKNELLLRTWSCFFNEMQIQINMKGNDWYDFYILSYVQPNDKYWTLERRWLNLIRTAGCENYLFQYEDK